MLSWPRHRQNLWRLQLLTLLFSLRGKRARGKAAPDFAYPVSRRSRGLSRRLVSSGCLFALPASGGDLIG